MKYIIKIIFLIIVLVLFSQYINSTEENITIDLDNITIEDNSSLDDLFLDDFNYSNEIVNISDNTTNESIYIEPSNEIIQINDSILEEINQTQIIEEITNDSENAANNTFLLKDEKNTTSEIEIKPKFAALINDKTTDTPEIKEYFKVYKNFSNIEFKDASKKEFGKKSINLAFRTKHEQKSKNGILADDELFIVDLIGCSDEQQTCSFRVNGLPILGLSGNDKITIKGKYKLKINSIQLNYCDNKRFCDYDHDAYDKIDAEIIEE